MCYQPYGTPHNYIWGKHVTNYVNAEWYEICPVSDRSEVMEANMNA